MRFHKAAALALTAAALTGCGAVSLAPGGRPDGTVVVLGAAAPYLPGGPPVVRPRGPEPADVYAATRPGTAGPLRSLPARLFLPYGRTVTVLDQRDLTRVRRIRLAAPVARVVPSWDLRTLWAFGPSALVPLDPRTLRAGPVRRLAGARDLVFTPDGSTALVLTDRRVEFRDPGSMELRRALRLPCAPTAAADFTAAGDRLVTACGGTLLFVDWRTGMSGTSALSDAPTRLLLSPDGARFYGASPSGLLVLDAATLRETARVRLGHGIAALVPGRSARVVYAAGPGALSAVGPSGAPQRRVAVPDRATLAAVSADGRTLWLRTPTGLAAQRLAAPTRTAPVPNTDLTLYPQPGRYSVGPHLR
ncbi:hypothetical protein EDD29_7810 [Actinocorallia herbida]|uniref:Uncharacterized protein n=1 Tax=Actinocorallia herbida TaxID=58109 RepID=A0A3N1D979_9ACTN|nr:hypothetical protein [Actinocorallia herbida]ROO90094.1 hypothetical protein EDD29_7810 [Actinocorallia herbida]